MNQLRAAFASLLLIGCAGNQAEKGDTGPEEPLEQHLWGGWTHHWANLSHRISLAGIRLDPDGTLSSAMVGGDWSTRSADLEDVEYQLVDHQVIGRGWQADHGSTQLNVGPEGGLTDSITTTLADSDEYDNIIVVLRGFRIDTRVDQTENYPDNYDPALGYCTRGFGFSLGPPQQRGTDVDFPLEVGLRWAPAGPDDPIDRSDMNGAIPFAQTAVQVDWTVLRWNGELEQHQLSGAVEYPHDPPYSEQLPLQTADLSPTVTPPNSGVPLITGFDLLLNVRDEGVEGQGEYVRSYGAQALASADGLQVQTELTNSSIVETAAINIETRLDLAWLSLADPEASYQSTLRSGVHEVGEFEETP
jgi:hypothetical protein